MRKLRPLDANDLAVLGVLPGDPSEGVDEVYLDADGKLVRGSAPPGLEFDRGIRVFRCRPLFLDEESGEVVAGDVGRGT